MYFTAEQTKQAKLNLLESIFGPFKPAGAEYLFLCPRKGCSDHKGKLSFNLDKDYVKCWICDFRSKSIYSIIQSFGNAQQCFEWLNLSQGSINESLASALDNAVEPNVLSKHLELPKEFISLSSKTIKSPLERAPRQYLKNRGLSFEDVLWWKIGYCPDGRYKNRVIVPSFDIEGQLNYFIARSYLQDAYLRYLNPQTSKDIVFNHLFLDVSERIILVEGVFDAIVAGLSAVPLLGSTLSEDSTIFNFVVNLDVPIYLALDPDAEHKQNAIINTLLRYDKTVLTIPLGSKFKDVGEMRKEEFGVCLAKASKCFAEDQLVMFLTSSFGEQRKVL